MKTRMIELIGGPLDGTILEALVAMTEYSWASGAVVDRELVHHLYTDTMKGSQGRIHFEYRGVVNPTAKGKGRGAE